MMTKKHISLIFVLLVIFWVIGCKKEPKETLTETNDEAPKNYVPPINPYSFIKDTVIFEPDNIDPTSIVGLQKNIFSLRCANPGCHDGNFEPDFRTPESSYYTLVYHPIVKNNVNQTFRYRVIPYDTANSVLHERITNCCFVNTNDRMPQDNIGVPLDQSDINNITQWILKGAPNRFGTIAQYPNLEPVINPFYVAADAANTNIQYQNQSNRVDTIFYNPFLLPDNKNILFAFFVTDDSTAVNQLLVNQFKISTNKDDFTGSINVNATYLLIPNVGEIYFANVNTASLPKNTQLYMRYVVNDGDHAQNTYFPTDNLPVQYKTFWSFIVIP